jgi:hypothetical protein
MAKLGFVQAFAKFGAVLDNPMWAVSAIAADGAVVLSCWSHRFRAGPPGKLLYVDKLSRWKGNEMGNRLLRSHLELALQEARPVRMVVATAADPSKLDQVSDASTLKKTFHTREDMVGQVVEFDGDNVTIEYHRVRR